MHGCLNSGKYLVYLINIVATVTVIDEHTVMAV
jgi:hypothetical protein